MTKLSVNLNKIALLRNSRGRDFPNVIEFANKLIALGVQGITVHPRQDERHITKKDAIELGELLSNNSLVVSDCLEISPKKAKGIYRWNQLRSKLNH